MSGRKRATEKRYRKPFKKPVQTGTHYNTQGRRGIRPPEICKGLGGRVRTRQGALRAVRGRRRR